MTKTPDKCDWCKKPLGRSWIEREGLYFCLQEYAPKEGRCSTHRSEIMDGWRKVIEAARVIIEEMPGINPDTHPDFARAATVLEFALEDFA